MGTGRSAGPTSFIPDFYERLNARRGLGTTCIEEVRKYDISKHYRALV
jgi:2-oxoglutarate ferredoxin oxidoreductase subunit beta